MKLPNRIKTLLASIIISTVCCICSANEKEFMHARTLQHEGKYDEAILAFKACLSQDVAGDDVSPEQMFIYTESLIQLLNSYQSKGEPEACISTLQEIYETSPPLQKYCLRDFYSVMGYALSRTERMKEAEDMTLRVFSLPLHHSTPERLFRDYAYAAAVFYSNPDYQQELVTWCEEALAQSLLCRNTSGKQWVTSMLGSVYKRNGLLNKALDLFLQSKEEAQERNDDLGVLNSLHTLIDLFLYWDVPEYANLYASEALKVEQTMIDKNPMISAQTYINKGRALMQLGECDSVAFFIEKAKALCQSLPYNSGMVDVELLHGIYLTEQGGDSMHHGIGELMNVTRQGTATNRAKAYHQLAQTYLKYGNDAMADVMLDSMYSLLDQGEFPIFIHIDYEPIINHYLKNDKHAKAEQFVRLMVQEHQSLKERRLNYNLVEAIVNQQTERKNQEIEIAQLRHANQRLWFMVCGILFILIIAAVISVLLYHNKQHAMQIKMAEENLAATNEKLSQTYAEKEMISQEFNDILSDKNNRQELESLTPHILQKYGESKFRQRFELLYPLFLPRLREKVPNITRREELLSMLIVLKQDNKEIAELFAIAPRSVLMLRHRFRQKIGINTDFSLEDFIESLLSE